MLLLIHSTIHSCYENKSLYSTEKLAKHIYNSLSLWNQVYIFHLQHISIWTSHISSVQQSGVASGYHTGQHSSRSTWKNRCSFSSYAQKDAGPTWHLTKKCVCFQWFQVSKQQILKSHWAGSLVEWSYGYQLVELHILGN